MANSTATVREVRVVIEDELTQCYVLYEAGGDSPLGVQGWHHKTFPASTAAIDIFEAWQRGDDNPLLWSQEAPHG